MNARSAAASGTVSAGTAAATGGLWSGPLAVTPAGLAALAAELGSGAVGSGGGSVSSWPPRSSDAVFGAIQKGERPQAIEVWALLGDEMWWTQRRGNTAIKAANEAAAVLWRAAIRDRGIASDLRWAAGAVLGGMTSGYPREIGDSWQAAAEPDRSVLRWIAEDDAAGLASRSQSNRVAPRRFLLDAGVPGDIALARKAARIAVERFVNAPNGSDEAFAVDCLRWMPPETRDAAVEMMLRDLSDDDASRLPQLRAQLVAWYAERSERLSASAMLRLQRWKGMAVWDDVEHFIERLFNRRVADLDHMLGRTPATDEDRQAKWALCRVAIWSNYSAQFSAVRIFVTRTQAKLLANADGSLPENVRKIPDHEAPSAIFTVGPYVVIQPLYDTIRQGPGRHKEARPARVFRGGPWRSGGEAYAAIAAISPNSPPPLPQVATVDCWGDRWQSRLYAAIEHLQIPRNGGLVRFRGFLPRHLNRDGLPL